MLEALYEAERLLPSLLMSADGWNGLFAASEKPNLKRLWRQWGENRIYLHIFGACAPGEVFPHPHPWKSAIRIVEGVCEMGVAFGDDPANPPPDFFRTMLVSESAYEITRPDGWHWVRPIGEGYASVMVAGPPIWPQNRVRSNTPSRLLTAEESERMRGIFSRYYR